MYSLASLRYVEAAARLKSFSAAARECSVTQPTVSASVAELESALGTKLFTRAGRQLELTSQGTRLVPKIAVVVMALHSLEMEATDVQSKSRSELRIGFTPLAGSKRVALLLEPYSTSSPETHVVLFESAVTDLEAKLEQGQLDVIIGSGFKRTASRRRTKLLDDRLVLCTTSIKVETPLGVSLEAASKLRLLFTEDLCGLATAARALFHDTGLQFAEYQGRALSYGALEDWVELGLGSAVMPSFHVRNRALAQPLLNDKGSTLYLSLEAVWRPHFAAETRGAEFLTYLHRVVPRLARGLA
jgi:DNA-binding transcriptional LysR family regulator